MRIHPVFSLLLGAAAITACEANGLPTIAGLSVGAPTRAIVALTVIPNQAIIRVGQSLQLTTNAAYTLVLQRQIEWVSLNPFVASVTPTGLVTGAALGTATIRARFLFDTTNVGVASITVVP